MGGACSTGAKTILVVRAWAGDSGEGNLVFPELDPTGDYGIPSLQEKMSLGIALSGGEPMLGEGEI